MSDNQNKKKLEEKRQFEIDQHTVPKAYLWRFVHEKSKSKKLHVYWKSDQRWHLTGPKTVTTFKLYYSRSGTAEDNRLEQWLNKNIETPASEPLRKLERGDQISSQERMAISKYIGCLFTRTSHMREINEEAQRRFLKPEVAIKFVNSERKREPYGFSDAQYDEFIAEMLERGIGLHFPLGSYLQLVERGSLFGLYITDMFWHIERTTSLNQFITSDMPAFCCYPKRPKWPYLAPLREADSEVCFPLSPTSFFRASYRDISRDQIRCSKLRVNELNRRVARHATNQIIVSEKTPVIESIINEESESQVRLMDIDYAVELTCR